MGTVRQVDEKLQKTLKEGRLLLEKLKRKQAEYMLLRQALGPSQEAEKAEALKLINEVTDCIGRLKADLKAADFVAHKIEGHIMWKEAVRSLWGEDGLQQCYAKMREMEAERALLYREDAPSELPGD